MKITLPTMRSWLLVSLSCALCGWASVGCRLAEASEAERAAALRQANPALYELERQAAVRQRALDEEAAARGAITPWVGQGFR